MLVGQGKSGGRPRGTLTQHEMLEFTNLYTDLFMYVIRPAGEHAFGN